MSGEVGKTFQVTQTLTNSPNDTQETNGLNTQENDVPSNNVDLPSVEEIISVCEIRLRKYFKRRRMEHRQILAQGYEIYDTTNSLNFGNENIFIDYYKDPTKLPSRSLRREKVTTGSWLFLSFMSGGWSYDLMKRFIMKQYRVKYLRNRYISQRLAMEEEYKAVVKFRSSEELNQVVTSLQHKNIHNKFLFFSFAILFQVLFPKHEMKYPRKEIIKQYKVPIAFYDSDSDC